ncbi:hypothetical protein [Bradyrhizobium sp.]|uniref:hypothetical protein n=1 Tax=Bradyrhizobium sp. TaxID=376 RepID=UPI002D449276|nr:hypothetical protein [Bradyrhizobium sp.]HZR74505.1 hypothetical protein [Bradyrhizobium sp.]
MDSSERYIEQAEFFRMIAETTRDPGARACLEYVGRSYEVLARSQKQLEQLERAAQHVRQLYRPLPGLGSQSLPPPTRARRSEPTHQ